jgi:hypothetical protein
MSNLNKLFCLAALLLAAVTVPSFEHSGNAAVLPQPGGSTVSAPPVTADSLPVPWCKAGPPHCIGVTAPKVVADSLPVPWGKKPAGARS